MNITKEQWIEIVSGILEFNRLVTTIEERNTEEYIIKCYNLMEDELDEYVDAEEGSEDELKELCDVIFTSVQLIDSMTPSQLQWEYVSKYLELGVEPPLRETLLYCMMDTLVKAHHNHGHDLYGAMMAVNASNMSKVVTMDYFPSKMFEWGSFPTMAYEIEKKNNGRYTGVVGKIHHPDGYEPAVVFRDDKLKVMKGPCYFEPDLAPYMHKQ